MADAELLVVENDGPDIKSTNYWTTPAARAGKVLVSVNAGAFRVLLPPRLTGLLGDMKAASGAAVTRGTFAPGNDVGMPPVEAFEILFDDGTNDPFSMHLAPSAFDRLPAGTDAGNTFSLTVWVRGARGEPVKALALPCTYRLASLPDLRPWKES